MRKIIVFNNVTLDGFMAGTNGELDWAIRDEEMTEYAKEGQGSTDTFLFGRVTYEMMASFWPTPAGKAMNPLYANQLNNAPKFVFSKTLKKADWENTSVVQDIHKEDILRMKQLPGKDMMIFGSGTIVEQLTNLGLIDEYQLLVNPVILGKGKPLFKDIKDGMKLKLVKTKTFNNGIVLFQYQPDKS